MRLREVHTKVSVRHMRLREVHTKVSVKLHRGGDEQSFFIEDPPGNAYGAKQGHAGYALWTSDEGVVILKDGKSVVVPYEGVKFMVPFESPKDPYAKDREAERRAKADAEKKAKAEADASNQAERESA